MKPLMMAGLGLCALALGSACVGEDDYCADVGSVALDLSVGTSAIELDEEGMFQEATYTGGYAFTRLSSGETLRFYRGVQGGVLVFASLQAAGFFPGTDAEIERYLDDSGAVTGQKALNPHASYELLDEDGTLLAAAEVDEPLVPDGSELQRSPDRVIFVPGTQFADVEGKTVSLHVTVTDYCGQTQSDEMTGMVLEYVPSPADQTE